MQSAQSFTTPRHFIDSEAATASDLLNAKAALLGLHNERCKAEVQSHEDRRAGTQEKHEWKTTRYSLLKFF